MAPPSKDGSSELNPRWLALRQKHQVDTERFKCMVTQDRQAFDERVAKARKDLLAKHIREEREFWSKNNRTAGTAKTATPAINSARMTTPSTARGSVAPPRMTAPPASRPVMSSRPQNMPFTPEKAARAQLPPAVERAPQAVRTRTATTIIDLTLDDEETSPSPLQRRTHRPAAGSQRLAGRAAAAQDLMDIDQVQNSTPNSMPDASLELFGDEPSEHLSTPTRPAVKNEEVQMSSPHLAGPFAKMGMGPQSPPASPPALLPAGFHNSSMFNRIKTTSNASGTNNSATGFLGRPGRVAPPSSSSTFRGQSSSQASASSSQVFKPEVQTWSQLARMNEQQREHSSIVSGANARSERSRSVAQEEQSSKATGGDDVQMQDASPQAKSAPMSGTAQAATSPSSGAYERSSPFEHRNTDGTALFTATGAEVRGLRKDTRTQQLPTPPPSNASVVSESVTSKGRETPAFGSSFKMPSMPASAAGSYNSRQAIAPEARHVRAGTTDSRALGFTFPGVPRSPRAASVTSRTSHVSGRTGATQNRKRKKVINLSSDEDEDPESDYAPSEPDSPFLNQSMKQTKITHTMKKTKANDGSRFAAKSTPRVEKVMGKNGYGFKITPAPKPKLGASSTLPSGTPALSVRQSSEAIQPKSKAATPTFRKTMKMDPIPQPSKRRAAIAAENKIQNFFENIEEFETELAIEEADHMETARLPDSMRSMSITPSPASQEATVEAESVDMLVDTELPRGFKTWSQTRSTGDRVLFQASVADADDSEADISYDIRSDKNWKARR